MPLFAGLFFAASVSAVVSSTPTLEEFEAVLRRHDSATRALEEWCAARGLADPARITASNLGADDRDMPRDARRGLRLKQGDTVAVRHVGLSCGQTVLSVAWNWYLPARLTPQMNETLRSGNAPFGKVVSSLRFRRRPLETMRGRADICPDGTISTHRAVLVLPDGRPLAYLVECYTQANLRSGDNRQ
ncbi:hypothetical protein [Novosphingobium sp.]|uniref:hypothetical protein n=1 Tax=Novosphingobium sp. TaxID=1874826 RepID=UPI002B467AF0|nr:hypothetical protein [Novosphingobium sp.]HKR91125.1 hypothetical protein [Novosphingobium sp.]